MQMVIFSDSICMHIVGIILTRGPILLVNHGKIFVHGLKINGQKQPIGLLMLKNGLINISKMEMEHILFQIIIEVKSILLFFMNNSYHMIP